MMSVRELIARLDTYPGDMRVVVSGYEQGYDDLSPEQISIKTITLNTGTRDWEGRHGDADDQTKDSCESKDTVRMLALHRSSN